MVNFYVSSFIFSWIPESDYEKNKKNKTHSLNKSETLIVLLLSLPPIKSPFISQDVRNQVNRENRLLSNNLLANLNLTQIMAKEKCVSSPE